MPAIMVKKKNKAGEEMGWEWGGGQGGAGWRGGCSFRWKKVILGKAEIPPAIHPAKGACT